MTWKMKLFIVFFSLGFVVLSVLVFGSSVGLAQRGNIVIEPQGWEGGYLCDSDGSCAYPTAQTVAENTNWTQYGSWEKMKTEDYYDCTAKKLLTLLIELNGNWYTASSTSPISIVSGYNPQNVYGQEDMCNPQVTPRATWVLKAKTGEACKSYKLKLQTWDYQKQYDWTITVSGTCSQPILDWNFISLLQSNENGNIYYYADYSLLYYFLGIIIILRILRLWL